MEEPQCSKGGREVVLNGFRSTAFGIAGNVIGVTPELDEYRGLVVLGG